MNNYLFTSDWLEELSARSLTTANNSCKVLDRNSEAVQTVFALTMDFTILESHHGDNNFIPCCNKCKVKSRITLFMLKYNVLRMCGCTYSTGQWSALSDDAEEKLSQANPLHPHRHCVNIVASLT